jgi:hypothetical protein
VTRSRRIGLGLVWMLASATASAQAATTWYVDASAPAPGSGTLASPYASIAYALAQPTTVAGDTLQVAPGTYFGNVLLSKGVTVRSTGGPQVTRILPTTPADTVSIANALAVLDGFSISGVGGDAAIVVQLENGTLRRCVVAGNMLGFYVGVEVTQGTIESCTIVGNRVGISGLTHFSGQLTLRNSIVAHNVQEDYTGNLFGPVDYCAGLDGDPYWLTHGVGNLPIDPQTHFPLYGQPQLQDGSPCIDAGDPLAPPDPDNSRLDIGAIPFERTFLPGPTIYCTGKVNSQGCVPAIGFQGQASFSSASPFLVTASQVVPNRVGLLFYGFASRAMPFQGGTHCVQPPTPRTAAQSSGPGGLCGGSFSFDMNPWIQANGDLRLVPGAVVCAQYWFRDPGEPAGFATGLSNAIQFAIAP